MNAFFSSDPDGNEVPQKKILLVEDEPEMRQALRLRLESRGYYVVEAEDGAMGLKLARQQHPDLILMDVMLPKMNGFMVARLLKFDEQYKMIPIVILTVLSQKKDIDMGKNAGANAYLTKPYQPQDLFSTIATLVAV